MDTVEGPRDTARRARECTVIGQAVTLARWIGNGRRPVTAGQVLGRPTSRPRARPWGVDVPPRLRTMADIRALHRPWCAAIATGLLQVGDGSVTAGPALECWPPDDADLLARWLTGLRAVCAAESSPQDEDSVRLLVMALLTVLGRGRGRSTDGLWVPVNAALDDLCETRNNLGCNSRGMSPTSSKNSVPRSATSNRPALRMMAPVKAPFSCPKSSFSSNPDGIAAQFTFTNG